MRFQELEALASILGISRASLYVDYPPPTALSESPLVRVRLPGEAAAQKLCERAVLVKAVLKVWGSGVDIAEAVQNGLTDVPPDALAKRRSVLAPPTTYQIRVAAFGRTVSLEDKRAIMDVMKPLFHGDEIADLRDPATTVWAIEEHSHQTNEKTHLGRRSGAPRRVIVGHQVAGGRSLDKKSASGEKAFYSRYELSERAVLGPTTMDNQLAFIMANCACAKPGSIALDPFCGTGGLLIATTHFGAQVYGGEIDLRVIKGWRVAYTKNKEAAQKVTKSQQAAAVRKSPVVVESLMSHDALTAYPLTMQHLHTIGIAPASWVNSSRHVESRHSMKDVEDTAADERHIFTNFYQYELPTPEIVICDTSVPPWRDTQCGWLDCIITDPPYGVRAAMKRQGRAGDDPVVIRDAANYIPSKVNYGDDELSHDLLELAAMALRDGGRITFLVPVDLADFLGIDRTAERGDKASARGNFRDVAMPGSGRMHKDKRLVISETTRDPLLLDESRYVDFIPSHSQLELAGASLQVLSAGLGRLLVTLRRLPRK